VRSDDRGERLHQKSVKSAAAKALDGAVNKSGYMRSAIAVTTIARARNLTTPKHTRLSFTTPIAFQPAFSYRPFIRHHMSEPEAKRIKMSNGTNSPVIGTHNGHFHADEALAVYLLRLLPEYTTSASSTPSSPAAQPS
jgi:hypothetical protein